MPRHKKKTRKYKPKNEFRKNNSPLAMGHPNYVFGETDTKFKSLGLTTHPDSKHRFIKLNNNPNSKDAKTSYVQRRVHTANKDYYSEPLKDWQFSKDDMSVIRLLIKQYKKSVNRKGKRNKKR